MTNYVWYTGALQPMSYTTLNHYGARYYDAGQEAWTQADSAGHAADPGQYDPYVYAGGNPVNLVDMNGRDAEAAQACIKGATVGGTASIVASGGTLSPFATIGGCGAGILEDYLARRYSEKLGKGLEVIDDAKSLLDELGGLL